MILFRGVFLINLVEGGFHFVLGRLCGKDPWGRNGEQNILTLHEGPFHNELGKGPVQENRRIVLR